MTLFQLCNLAVLGWVGSFRKPAGILCLAAVLISSRIFFSSEAQEVGGGSNDNRSNQLA